MSLSLPEKTELRLREVAAKQSVNVEALLESLLDDAETAQAEEIAAVKQDLLEVATGKTRPFAEFIAGHRRRYPPQTEAK